MLITPHSLKTLALVAVFAKNAIAQATSATGISIASLPAPTDPPNFQYSFNVVFEGGQCSGSQQLEILNTMQNVAGLADRAKLWKTDPSHDRQDEVDYWFGSGSADRATWIKSNAALDHVFHCRLIY